MNNSYEEEKTVAIFMGFCFPCWMIFQRNRKKNYVLIYHLNYITLGLRDIIYNINEISPILNKKNIYGRITKNTEIINIPLYQFSQPDMRKS